MNTAEQNYLLLQEIEASRDFLLMAYRQNPELLKHADARIRQIFEEPLLCTQPATQEDKQRGATLIELVLFIVIISIAVAGILLVMNQVTGHSADALVRKQALAIAESLLEEIELQGMSGVNTATGSANANRTSFDNVFNYNGYSTTTGIQNMDTTAVAGLTSYNVTPAVQVVAITSGELGAVPAASAVRITVSVTGPGGQIDLTGYRTAY